MRVINIAGKSFGDSLIIGTQVLKLKESAVEPAKDRLILTIAPKVTSNDHEASSSQAKPRDPKYTQPRWCPTGLNKTHKRKLQWLRNCLLYTSPSPRDGLLSRMPSSA